MPIECYDDIGRYRRAYATNYRDIIILVEDEASTDLPQESEVHLPIQTRSHLDYMNWSMGIRLNDLSSEVRRTRCIQALYDDYSLRSIQQPGWRIVSRGEVLVLIKCKSIVVRRLLTANTCSEQLAVQDEDGRPWRLHAGNRLLTDFGVKVPCGAPATVFTFLTEEGKYVEQSPDLKEVTFNFTSSNRANSLPSFLAMEEDKLLFQSPDPFDEPGGLYSEEEVEGTEEAFFREWSILTGTPPEALLTPQEASPPASAASSAHARIFPSTAEAAMQGVETFLRSSIRACLGRVMSTMEQFVLTLILLAGNLYAVCMLAKRL